MLKVPVPGESKHQGMDFSPLLRGEKTKWRDTIYGQYDLHNGGLAHMRMIRTDRWSFIRHHHAKMMDELYDLQNDPGQLVNLARNPQHRETRDGLQSRLTAWMKSIDDPLLREK